MDIGPLSVSNLPAVYFDGIYRVLGCLPSDNNHDFPNFGTVLRGAASFQLKEIDLSWWANRIMDQGQTSGCVGHGCAAGMEIVWRQLGNPPQTFAPFFIYGLVNHGQDQGASISEALVALKQSGAAPLADVPPGQMFQQQFSQQAFNNAKRFRIAQAYKCGSFEEICQAINVGFTVPLGIYVGSNFPQLDSEGVAPLPAGGGGGHCLLGCGLKQSQRYGWVIKVQNSWGQRFGLNGFCYLQKDHFSRMQPDAFAIQATFDDPQDTDNTNDVPVVTG
jgi:hypothetical protein